MDEFNEKYSLAELSEICYLFGNDLRLLHLYTSGKNFFRYHEELEDLYNISFDMFDSLAEMAIAHNEEIYNPSCYAEMWEWDYVDGNKFKAEDILEYVTTIGKLVMDAILDVDEYESYVQSKIDSFMEELDSLINYKFTQAMKEKKLK